MKRLFLIILTAIFFVAVAYAAGIDGAWDVKYEIPDDTLQTTVRYKTNGSALFIVTEDGEQEVGTIKDGTFAYKIPKYYSEQAGYSADLMIKGKLDGDKISGTWEWDTYNGSFAGSRVK
jgi:hypothetical protein